MSFCTIPPAEVRLSQAENATLATPRRGSAGFPPPRLVKSQKSVIVVTGRAAPACPVLDVLG